MQNYSYTLDFRFSTPLLYKNKLTYYSKMVYLFIYYHFTLEIIWAL
jgi:hypothetical protein